MSDTHNTNNHHSDNHDHSADVSPNWGSIRARLLLVAAIGILLFVSGIFLLFGVDGASGLSQIFSSYLIGWIYWLSLPMGGLILLCIQYFAGGRWGIVLRRILEANTRTLPLMMVLFAPLLISIFLGNNSPYWWTKPMEDTEKLQTEVETMFTTAQKDAIHELKEKREDYLNPPFVAVRAVLFFAIMGGLILILNVWGKRLEATGEWKYRERLKNIAGPGAMIFALGSTPFLTDWVMSLEPNWSSTMFPVIYGINQILTCFAFCIVMYLYLIQGPLKSIHWKQDQINLGSFMLAFTLFWTYTSFAQFLLIWAGNLPEEIPFYLKRSRGGWQIIVTCLAIFHFACPLLLLLMRDIKTSRVGLRSVAIGLMVICGVDVFWWIEPTVPHNGKIMFWFLDIGAIMGIGGIWGWYFIGQLTKSNFLPTHEGEWLKGVHHHG